MVRIKGNKKLNIYVIYDIISKEEAEKRMAPYKKKAFGMISSWMKSQHEVMISGYVKRLEPIWHIEGESLLEYKRASVYSVPVKAEVRTVRINGKAFEVDEANPVLEFEGEDHCFESYHKTVTKNAIGGSDKKLDRYVKAPAKKLKNVDELYKMTDVLLAEPTIKASYLVRDLVKDLIKPFHADVVIQEKVELSTINLYFRPIHVFELSKGSKKATLEVNGISGEVIKSREFANQIKRRLKTEATWFDVGAELASVIVPGAGAGVVLSKYAKDKYSEKKKRESMKKSQQARSKIRR